MGMKEELKIEALAIIKKLREPSNWLKQARGEKWKSALNVYDKTPFDAADLIVKLLGKD